MNLLFEAPAGPGNVALPILFEVVSVEKITAVCDGAARIEVPRGAGERELSDAREEGREAAAQEFAESLEALRSEDREARRKSLQSLERERGRYFADVEGQVVKLALAIAKQILQREVKVDPVLLAGVVRVALQGVAGDENSNLFVATEDVFAWKAALGDCRMLRVHAEATLERGDCRLEAAGSVAELGVAAQLVEVERGFLDLLARRPA